MDSFEVTGGLRLGEPPARREGCCLFVTYQWGNPQAPIYRGNADRAKLPHGYVAEKTSPRASASGPKGTEKKPIVFLRMMKIARFFKGLEISTNPIYSISITSPHVVFSVI
jgi:hypothetical protein